MSEHLDFREGRRLAAADLNREHAAREADLEQHRRLAHRGRGLVGGRIAVPGGSPALDFTPDGPVVALRFTLGDEAEALNLNPSPSSHRGHRADAVTANGTEVRVTGAVRLVAQTGPSVEPLPWSVRAIEVPGDDGQVLARELRVELAVQPGSPPHGSRVAVGRVEDNTFLPVLVADAAGSVRIVGHVEVAGSVTQGEITPDPEDPRFMALLTDLLASRIVGTATSAPTAGFQLTAQVAPARSTPQRTTLDVTVTPAVTLARWGAALAVERSGTTRFVLVELGRDAAPGVAVRFPAGAEWSPDLTAAAPATLTVAVVAFDLQNRLRAQIVRGTVP
ncbi:hypothetical protein G6045_09805 [Streptomyces sp. YC504]|uniref:Uncharacterized protein n=1 Tax=Streptomyces mesophilus TaxID=1775132 RepID=A0A6G4XEK2_9ACTN|nr:hypothetical protein [Streptomyces mesophilus]NGO75965.1 hypothetical protein [Streptomyces mesophilus]